LLAVLGPAVETWNRSLGELRIYGGARIHIDGADDGALRIQGSNLRGAWCDEVGLWREWRRAWEESVGFAVRLDPGRIIATGTPKGRSGIPKLLIDDDDVPVTRMRMEDNVENLSEAMVAALSERFAGTRLGRQELEGELLDDVEGALWKWAQIEEHRIERDDQPELRRIVVAIDPPASSEAASAEAGIVVCGLGSDGDGYVLGDLSLRASPHEWAQRAVLGYREFGADRIIAERNNGGEMVEATLRTVAPKVPVKTVWASRGKQTRAEPIAALYEQGRVHHVGAFPELETQLTGWAPDLGHSPDRLDALVWGMTELILEGQSRTVKLGVAGA
jgi:phage terminase large subunit-like protein